MRSRIGEWDNLVRQLLLISVLVILFAGPAAAMGLDAIYDDEMFGESTPWEWAPLVFIVWLFAVPIGLAYAKWEDNPITSASWLAVFLGILSMLSLVGIPVVHMTSALVFGPALLLPFIWFDISGPPDDVAYWITKVCSFMILIGVPIVALLFQTALRNHKPQF